MAKAKVREGMEWQQWATIEVAKYDVIEAAKEWHLSQHHPMSIGRRGTIAVALFVVVQKLLDLEQKSASEAKAKGSRRRKKLGRKAAHKVSKPQSKI